MNTKFEGANRLMLITHQTETYTDYEEAKRFLEGGGSWVQLRQKEGLDREMAHRLAELCRQKNGVLCVDDNVDIALEIGADAVHLGKNDMPVDEAWKVVRKAHREKDFLIGATTNTFEDIRQAARSGASYIGLGPFRFTQTKKRLSPILGLEGYRRIISQCEEAGIHLPIYAIGGIELEDIPDLMKAGVHGIAISGSIIRADNPAEMTRRFLEKILEEV
ncbi:MAG TPA: thiamine phosphate synthase [Candidatus Parabacteroides intestinavium]|nr:thiamine phosphate synthase [Candidatus Parabacteroides intestinavium]